MQAFTRHVVVRGQMADFYRWKVPYLKASGLLLESFSKLMGIESSA
jgi:hypothetical protein